MRISTAQYYKTNADQLQARQNKVAEVQAKLGSGKQLLHPSENPSKADLISRLESGKGRQAVYSKNVDAAQTRLTSEEAVLTSMTQIMQRITELTIQGGNDTLAAEDRAVIAAEVKALRDELLNLEIDTVNRGKKGTSSSIQITVKDNDYKPTVSINPTNTSSKMPVKESGGVFRADRWAGSAVLRSLVFIPTTRSPQNKIHFQLDQEVILEAVICCWVM